MRAVTVLPQCDGPIVPAQFTSSPILDTGTYGAAESWHEQWLSRTHSLWMRFEVICSDTVFIALLAEESLPSTDIHPSDTAVTMYEIEISTQRITLR